MTYASRIVVFDLDETLGYFQEYGIFWNSLNEYLLNKKCTNCINENVFNKILDLYPEFIRPNILPILSYLKEKKIQGKCSKILIYTNNQAPKDWTKMIQNYFDKKLNYCLFDQIIGAFKINGEIIEMGRTSNSKNIDDLICCTHLPRNIQICFIDDVLYPGMISENVYYINIKPYSHYIPFENMIDRFLNSNILHDEIKDKEKFKVDILSLMNKYKYKFHVKTNMDYTVDKILSKKILEHLHTFFKTNYPETPKKNKKINKTRKKI